MGSFCSSSSSSTTQIPGWLSSEFQNAILPRANEIANTPYQPYTGQLVAGLNDLQGQGLTGLSQVAGASIPYVQSGSSDVNQGVSTVSGASPYFNQGAAGLGFASNFLNQAGQGVLSAQPYLSQAGSYASQGAGPLQWQQYMSPYTQQVVDATQAQFNNQNAQNANNLLGTAIKSGNAFGGDRAGVAQAQLAGQEQTAQAPVIAGLYNQGFQTALGAAQNQAQNELGAANVANTSGGLTLQGANTLGTIGNIATQNALGYGTLGNSVVNQGNTIGNLGVAQAGIGSQYQNNSMNAYLAQLQGGTQAQATDQAGLNAAYGQYQNQVAFPYQQIGWLSGVASGINPGSTTNSTTTPSLFSMLAHGGRVHRASGGSVGGIGYLAGGPISLTGGVLGSFGGLIPQPPAAQPHGLLGANGAKSPNTQSQPNLADAIGKGAQFGNQAVNFFNDLGASTAAAGATDAAGAGLGALADASAMGDAALGALMLHTGGSVPHRAGGGPTYLFGDAGAPTAMSGIPGGTGLIPTIRFSKGSAPASPKISAPSTTSQNSNLLDKGKQIESSLGDLSSLFSSSTGYGAGDAIGNPLGLGGLYRRGGSVPHFDDGGNVDFADRWAPVDQALDDFTFVPGKFEQRGLGDLMPTSGSPVVNPDDPIRIDGSYHDNPDNNVPMTPERAAANYRGDDLPSVITQDAGNSNLPTAALGYSGESDRPTGLGALMPPTSLVAQPGGQTDRIAAPQLVQHDGNAPAPGLLGQIGLTRDGGNALLQGIAGFLGAAGHGGLGVGIANAITGATGSLASADAERSKIAQTNFENSLKSDQNFQNRQRIQMEAQRLARDLATGDLVPDGSGGYKPNQDKLNYLQRVHDITESDPAKVKELNAAGIDPKSPEGRAYLLSGVPPSGWQRNSEGKLEYIPNGPADPVYIAAAANAKRVPGMSDEAMAPMIAQYRAGNQTAVLSSLARGTNGPANLNRFWTLMQEQLKAEGATGKDLAAAKAGFTAQSAAARTAAVREANVASAVEEAKGTFPLALQRSEELPRSQFVPWNRAVQAVQAGTSSPALARFVTANQAVITAYSQAMSRTGVTSVNAQHHAEALLSTANSPEAYAAVIHQMEQEMDMALTAPEKVKQRILGGISGRDDATSSSLSTKAESSKHISAADQKALEWAKANPSDPRAAKIKQRLGAQ